MEGDSSDNGLPVSTGISGKRSLADEGGEASSGGNQSPASQCQGVQEASALDGVDWACHNKASIQQFFKAAAGILGQLVTSSSMARVPGPNTLHHHGSLLLLHIQGMIRNGISLIRSGTFWHHMTGLTSSTMSNRHVLKTPCTPLMTALRSEAISTSVRRSQTKASCVRILTLLALWRGSPLPHFSRSVQNHFGAFPAMQATTTAAQILDHPGTTLSPSASTLGSFLRAPNLSNPEIGSSPSKHQPHQGWKANHKASSKPHSSHRQSSCYYSPIIDDLQLLSDTHSFCALQGPAGPFHATPLIVRGSAAYQHHSGN